MSIAEAQRDVRRVYVGGFVGQLVSGVLWFTAAAAGTWISTAAAVWTLFLGGVLIFPITTLVIRLSGRPSALPSGHPMAALAAQVAFTVPLGLLVVIATAGDRLSVFFPAAMVIVGAHYLPFVFLYGMRLFAVLAVALVGTGAVLLFWLPDLGAFGGWFTGAVLVLFAVLLHVADRRERRA